MKNDFKAGLAILLPIMLTLIIVGFLINFFTGPFLKPTEALFNYLGILQNSSPVTVLFVSKILILISLGMLIILIGWLARHFLVEYFFQLTDTILHRMPFINRIYKPCREVVNSLLSSGSTTFKQVVLIPFPDQNQLCIGLIAQDSIQFSQSEFISVFVPGTPNPTVGFMLMFKKEEMILLNMKVDEAIKFIISCGVVLPEFIYGQK